jgi:hypothetical protein
METAVMVGLKKSLWKRLKISWSLYKLLWPTAVAWSFGIAAFAVGFACSNQETSLPFARSGSAVTALFIFSTIFSVDHLAKRSEQSANDQFKKLTAQLPNTGSESQSKIEAKTAKSTEHLIRVNIILSAVGLCSATIVWGFGDLLAYSRFRFFLPFP